MKRPIIPHLSRRSRQAKWARTVACCPECQVGPGIACHRDGMPLPHGTVHARRYQEAEEVAA